MDQGQAIIREKVLRFYQAAKQLFPIKKVLLYGSYANGLATEYSDIDVAVVIDQPDHSKRIEITARLFHAAFDIDAAIEPKCIFWDEYVNPDKASILSEIIKKSIEIA
ncbi:MAG: nucleotidyltransferase domain-containing protein [Sedimentisphaerales bacterium]|nr:nucleotidyltransferase domain-containing protein [Sedimentisphaerales bacterium]